MLKKVICQKCYQFNEREWSKDIEDEWVEGMVMCPCDHFETIQYRGKETKTGDMRGLFAGIYGWRKISEGIPKWCKFKEDHL